MGSADQVEQIVLFDGVCNLCNSSVNFIVDRDPKVRFKFAALQSEKGQELLSQILRANESSFDSIVLISNNSVYIKSSAALRIARHLNGLWPILYSFIIIPKPIRDFVYDFIAKNRYKWFGKSDACRIPTPDLQSRFIE